MRREKTTTRSKTPQYDVVAKRARSGGDGVWQRARSLSPAGTRACRGSSCAGGPRGWRMVYAHARASPGRLCGLAQQSGRPARGTLSARSPPWLQGPLRRGRHWQEGRGPGTSPAPRHCRYRSGSGRLASARQRRSRTVAEQGTGAIHFRHAHMGHGFGSWVGQPRSLHTRGRFRAASKLGSSSFALHAALPRTFRPPSRRTSCRLSTAA